jgi:metal-responsive CopG/Arc/MetJ family transcriptional regulator
MSEYVVVVKLNQQQLELLDRTIAQGAAVDRTSLMRLALREYAEAHRAEAAPVQSHATGERA